MLTALTIENLQGDKWYKRLYNVLRGNSLRVEINSARGVALRHIIYINRTGRVDWLRLNSVVGSQRNHLLCGEDIALPGDLGFRRFDNRDFKIKLAGNLGIYVLSRLEDKDIAVGLYDPCGEQGELLGDIVRYTSNAVAVSDNTEAYSLLGEKICCDTGATVQATDNRSRLGDCRLVIAPEQIRETLPLRSDAVVLSSQPPTVCTPGLVYYDYRFRMPNKFDTIKPRELSEEYFAGALYTKARQYELGSIVPTLCCNFGSTQTIPSICQCLSKSKQ